jgi:hypothetical protein
VLPLRLLYQLSANSLKSGFGIWQGPASGGGSPAQDTWWFQPHFQRIS